MQTFHESRRGSPRPFRLLIADADPVTRRIAGMALTGAGHSVTTAADSDTALDALKAHGFDLALIALDLPGLGGIETAKLYRFMAVGRARIPILGIAGGWSLDSAARAGEAGIAHILGKPLIASELIDLVGSELAAAVPRAVRIDDPFGTVTPLFGAATPRPPAIDPDLIRRLGEIGDSQFVAEVADDFITAGQDALNALSASQRRRSVSGMHEAGRQLESLARNVGADLLARMAATLADAGAIGVDQRAADQLRQTAAELRRVEAALIALTHPPSSARG